MRNLVPSYNGVPFYLSPEFWAALVTPLVIVFLPYLLQYVPFPVDVNQANVISVIVAFILSLLTHKTVRVLKAR